MKSSLNRPLVIVIASIAVLILAFVAWLYRPISIEDQAARSLQALLDSDVSYLYEGGIAHEREPMGLNPLSCQWLVESQFAPVMRQFRTIGPIRKERLGAGAEGSASVTIADSQGHKYELGVVVWQTDEGARHSIADMLSSVWILQYLTLQGKELTNLNAFDAMATGAETARSELEKHGINGRNYILEPGVFKSWGEFSNFYRALMMQRDQVEGTVQKSVEEVQPGQ